MGHCLLRLSRLRCEVSFNQSPGLWPPGGLGAFLRMCLLPPRASEHGTGSPAPLPVPPPLQPGSNQPWTTGLEPARSLPNEHLIPAHCRPCIWASSGFVRVLSSPPGSCHQGRSTSWLSLLSVGCHPKSLRATLGNMTLTGNKKRHSPLLITIPRRVFRHQGGPLAEGRPRPAGLSGGPAAPRTGKGGGPGESGQPPAAIKLKSICRFQ